MSGGHHTDRLLFPSETDIPHHLVETSLKKLKLCTTSIENNFIALDLKPYPESKSGFQIICADIMLDDKGTPYILEINRRCGFSYGMKYDTIGVGDISTTEAASHWKKMNHKFSTDFFDWVCNSVIFPHFAN